MNFTIFFANTQNCILFSRTAIKYYFLVIQKYFLSGNFFKITFTKYRSSKLFLLQFVSEIENKHFHGKFLHFSPQVLFISSKKLPKTENHQILNKASQSCMGLTAPNYNLVYKIFCAFVWLFSFLRMVCIQYQKLYNVPCCIVFVIILVTFKVSDTAVTMYFIFPQFNINLL